MTVWAVAAGVLVIVLLGVLALLVLVRQLRLRRYEVVGQPVDADGRWS